MTTTFTESEDAVRLVPVPMPDGSRPNSWTTDDPDTHALVIRLARIDAPTRYGMPTRGYLVRAWDSGGPFGAWESAIWWVTSRKRALTLAQVLCDNEGEALGNVAQEVGARPMFNCLNWRCQYHRSGAVPHMWDGHAQDWVCPRCKTITEEY